MIQTKIPVLLTEFSYALCIICKRTRPYFALWLLVPHYVGLGYYSWVKTELNLEEFVRYLSNMDGLCLYLRDAGQYHWELNSEFNL